MNPHPTLQLYSYFRSSAAFRVRIALHAKRLAFDTVATSLIDNRQRSPEYLSLNPQGLVPALATDGAVISQSLAIIEYLDERYPEPPLLPQDALGRALVRSMTLAVACEIHPLNNLRVLNYLREHAKLDDDGVSRWYRHWIAAGFAALEVLTRTHSSAARYCYADTLTVADIYLVPQMFNARRFKCDLTPYPTLTRISSHLETLDAFARAAPEQQPDAG